MQLKHIVYMIADEVKLQSDDSYYTNEHIMFLVNKYRSLILKQTYSNIKKEVSESNYQTICLNLEKVDGESCVESSYLRSVDKIPTLLPIGNPLVYTVDYYNGEITLVSKEKMRYVGYNKFLKNIIYASIGPDNRLYFKSNNPQHMYLRQVKFTAIFDDCENAAKLTCKEDSNQDELPTPIDEQVNNCDPIEQEYALEESLVPSVIQLVVKELLGAAYRPSDNVNNSADDLTDIIAWARKNMKSDAQKQIEGNDS